MGARYLSVTLFLALLAAPAAAGQAQGSGGDDARRVGARHHSPRPSRSTPTAVRRNPGASPSSFSDAVNRHPRAGTGHGSRGRFFYRPSRHYYYSPYRTYFGYGGFPYFDFYYGYGYGYGHYPYYGGGYYPGRHYYRGDRGSVRVLVDPPQTRVYVDGYYAGVADDFDGFFQRLHVAPGRHEIGLRLEGFEPHRLRVYVPYDGTLKIHHDMVEGGGDGSFENLAGDADEPRAAAPWRDEPREPREPRDEREREPRYGARSAEVTGNASVRFDVRPEGASIYVDGEFQGTGGSLHSLELPGGTHRVEILHPGLRTFERDLTLRPGESFDLEVELTK